MNISTSDFILLILGFPWNFMLIPFGLGIAATYVGMTINAGLIIILAKKWMKEK